MRLFHDKFGFITMSTERLCSNQWVGFDNVRYGTFIDTANCFVALPLSEVKVIG